MTTMKVKVKRLPPPRGAKILKILKIVPIMCTLLAMLCCFSSTAEAALRVKGPGGGRANDRDAVKRRQSSWWSAGRGANEDEDEDEDDDFWVTSNEEKAAGNTEGARKVSATTPDNLRSAKALRDSLEDAGEDELAMEVAVDPYPQDHDDEDGFQSGHRQLGIIGE